MGRDRHTNASAGSLTDTTTVTNVYTVISPIPNRRQRRETNGATTMKDADITARPRAAETTSVPNPARTANSFTPGRLPARDRHP
jgi:hypothetical protein